MAKTPRQLDSRIQIVTPENIAFDYVLAGPFRRLPAFLIDVVIRAGVLLALFLGVFFSSAVGAEGLGWGVFLVVWFVMSWFYGGLFETFWNGQTPGKWLLGLRVLSLDGQPINAMQAVLRNVLRDVDALPMVGFLPLYMLALIAMASTDRYQRLGDLACGTMVVVEKRSKLRGLAVVSQAEVVAFAQQLPPNLMASRGLSHALSIYVARRELLSGPRRFEIARTLAEPLAQRWGLPADTNPDLLLVALYYRTFIADRPGNEARELRRPLEVAGP